jgi:hypothetical protein
MYLRLGVVPQAFNPSNAKMEAGEPRVLEVSLHREILSQKKKKIKKRKRKQVYTPQLLLTIELLSFFPMLLQSVIMLLFVLS